MDWLKNPGFFGTHATIGADISQLMATFFTGLFVIGWIQARKRQSDAHHWLMLGGMVAMLGFFVSYYLFRQLGVLAFEGKEGFGGSESAVPQCVYPSSDLSYHSGDYWIGHGGLHDRAGIPSPDDRARTTDAERPHPSDDVGKDRHIFGVLCALVALYLLVSAWQQIVFGWDDLWCGSDLLALIAIVFAVEMAIQRIWPDGGQRHRTLGRFTMIIYCVLFVTGTTTYTMLYILYPGKIG